MMCRIVLLSCALLSGCNLLTGPRGAESEPEVRTGPDGWLWERRIGTIEHYGDPVRIEVPDSVQRGEEFGITVWTYGGGCINEGDTVVQVDGKSAVVTPYDWEVVRFPPNGACTLELRLHEHSATLRFQVAGAATVEIRGRSKPSGEGLRVRRDVVVR